MKTVLITGGTGMVGNTLCKHLEQKGYRIIIYTRNPSKYKGSEQRGFAAWNPGTGTADENAFTSADYIVNLAGAPVVEKKWTDAYKSEILESRTNSGKLICKLLANTPHKIQAIVSASAIGWYGPDKPGKPAFTETDPANKDFLGDTCRAWEESIEAAATLAVRLVKTRIGIVMSKTGGALQEFRKPLRLGVAGILGNGNQVVSWIHIDDLCRMIIYALEEPAINGVYNAVAPHPVSNRELTLTLARNINGKFFIALPVPEFVLKLMMGERSIEVLKSANVSSKKIMNAGFNFDYPDIQSALKQLNGKA